MQKYTILHSVNNKKKTDHILASRIELAYKQAKGKFSKVMKVTGIKLKQI